MEGDGATEGDATAFHPGRLVSQALAELVEEPGLADPGLPHQEHGLTGARLRLVEEVGQRPELALAADVGRQPALRHHLQPGPGLSRRDDFPDGDGLGLALENVLAQGAGVEIPLDEAVGGLGDDDAAAIGELLQPGRGVGRIADSRVVHAEVAADRAHDDQTGVEPLADLKSRGTRALKFPLVAIEGPADAEGGVDRALGVVLVGDRGTEERHDAVAQELVDRALVPVDLGQHQLESTSHEPMDILGVEARGERR